MKLHAFDVYRLIDNNCQGWYSDQENSDICRFMLEQQQNLTWLELKPRLKESYTILKTMAAMHIYEILKA